MPDYTQTGKPVRFSAPSLAADSLLLERLVGREDVSKPFELTLDLLSLDTAVDQTKLLRKPITIEMDLPDGSVRYINGIVRRFVQLGRGATFTTYRAEVVPTIWLLSLSADCKVFQAKKGPDIVKQVLDDMGITDYRFTTTASAYPVRDYTVQYRETHLDFISRLLEEEGVFYYFEHTKDKHTIVFADLPTSAKPATVAKLPMNLSDPASAPPNTIIDLAIGSVVTTGKITLADYNDTGPTKLQSNTAAGASTYTAASIALFDYPGKFDIVANGDRASRLLMEEREALSNQVNGHTNCMGVCSGYKLTISGHYRSDINVGYHILSVEHDATVSSYQSTIVGKPVFTYVASFQAIPSTVQYRPPRMTPRPIVHGSQTAVVVGPSGEEIYVDKYGRVKVQFFWDRVGTMDDGSSCWIRVSSTWAGKNWGFIQLPRIGQEVVVDFLEGDPDRPIVTGRVYNGEMMPPYTLPDNGTQSGLKTRSSKGGGTSDYNELRFEDKKGSEEVHLHSMKDLNSITENNETWTVVSGGRTTSIKMNDATEITDGDQSLKITKGKQDIIVHVDRTTTIETGNETLTVKQGKMATEVSTGDYAMLVKTGKMSTEVDTGDQSNTVKTGNYTNEISTGNLTTTVSLGNLSTDVKVGNISIKADAGKITIEALQGIDLKVGGNTISIGPAGITAKGTLVSIQGQGTAELKSPMTTVSGDGMLTLKGGVTMIN